MDTTVSVTLVYYTSLIAFATERHCICYRAFQESLHLLQSVIAKSLRTPLLQSTTGTLSLPSAWIDNDDVELQNAACCSSKCIHVRFDGLAERERERDRERERQRERHTHRHRQRDRKTAGAHKLVNTRSHLLSVDHLNFLLSA